MIFSLCGSHLITGAGAPAAFQCLVSGFARTNAIENMSEYALAGSVRAGERGEGICRARRIAISRRLRRTITETVLDSGTVSVIPEPRHRRVLQVDYTCNELPGAIPPDARHVAHFLFKPSNNSKLIPLARKNAAGRDR
jgi:hypothetical protein